ncbi:hypothetical protein LFL96_01665 [Paraburkholderia sp. D15]|uniref:hypothetical protein n=1 Tax=Paraburkholderia sp. D15 TaxID=2880218 RepID=UPI0024792631|nr:hypothetical protein [Paraburkholderia sp. D15]WGS50244.1 hypothetical protein LFL96_01665 [Paraburkholderia sp. D15]
MSNFLSRFSWALFNVAVPILAPLALLPLLGFSRFYQRASKGAAMRSMRDGQLLWVVISMCASACYEIGRALSSASSDGVRAAMFAGLVWHGVFIVASAVIVSFGVADAMPTHAHDADDLARSRRLMRGSILMTALVATSYCISHFSLT